MDDSKMLETMIKEWVGTAGLDELRALMVLTQIPSEDRITLDRMLSRVLWEGLERYKQEIRFESMRAKRQ